MYVMKLSCKKNVYLTLIASLSIFSIFFFLSPNAEATDHIYYNDSTKLWLNYRVCLDQTSATGKYQCDRRTAVQGIHSFYYDASTGVNQYSFTPDYSYCRSSSYPCRLVIDNFYFDIENGGSVPTDPFVNGKVWTNLDFYFGKYPQISGELIWDNKYNITDSLDMSTTTADGRLLCGDDSGDNCKFGYLENDVVYDSTSKYSGFDFSLKTSIVSTSYLRVNFGAYPYDKSLGHLNMTDPVYYNIVYETTNSSPIIFYASFWGTDAIQDVQDNGDDNGVTDIVQEMNKIDEDMQNAQDSADEIDMDFSVPNVVSPFVSLFTDQSCVSIINIGSWLHSTETYVCSPWPSTVRSVLTPICSFMMILLR